MKKKLKFRLKKKIKIFFIKRYRQIKNQKNIGIQVNQLLPKNQPKRNYFLEKEIKNLDKIIIILNKNINSKI